MDGPLLWYVNRGTGLVLLVLLTLTTVMGVLATRGDTRRWLPRFVTQSLHRNLSLLSVTLLFVHVVTAVADEYVDIRWWQALVPFGATYKPLWLELGTLALDLVVVVALTSLLRRRLPHRRWRAVHLTAYAAWALSVAHGLGIGTDATARFMVGPTLACVAMVGAAGSVRALWAADSSWRARRAARPSPSTAWEPHR
jgi:sulfoxide reductase heme-binding subunit YedZ